MSPSTKHWERHLLFSLTGIFAAVCQPADGAWAKLWLDSQPGDFIGGGQQHELVYDSLLGAIVIGQIQQSLPTGEPSFLRFLVAQDELFTLSSGLDFSTNRLGIPIAPGFYPNAQKAGFEALGRPGLDVDFDGRGCNIVTGNFTISELAFNPDNSIERFTASFEQHCEGWPPALFGTFTYFSVPEPATIMLVSAGLMFAIQQRHRRNNSSRHRSN